MTIALYRLSPAAAGSVLSVGRGLDTDPAEACGGVCEGENEEVRAHRGDRGLRGLGQTLQRYLAGERQGFRFHGSGCSDRAGQPHACILDAIQPQPRATSAVGQYLRRRPCGPNPRASVTTPAWERADFGRRAGAASAPSLKLTILNQPGAEFGFRALRVCTS